MCCVCAEAGNQKTLYGKFWRPSKRGVTEREPAVAARAQDVLRCDHAELRAQAEEKFHRCGVHPKGCH